MILTYDKRQAYWNWCREFIDREAIYRADDTGSACGCAPPAARRLAGVGAVRPVTVLYRSWRDWVW